jgi:hypothetical protein
MAFRIIVVYILKEDIYYGILILKQEKFNLKRNIKIIFFLFGLKISCPRVKRQKYLI